MARGKETVMARGCVVVPAPLADAARRFHGWRRIPGRGRIPADLWALAADLGRRYGLSRVSRALRLQYYDLKAHVETESGTDGSVPRAAFVELGPPPGWTPIEWSLEIEEPTGSKVRLQVRGGSPPDPATLGRLVAGRRA